MSHKSCDSHLKQFGVGPLSHSLVCFFIGQRQVFSLLERCSLNSETMEACACVLQSLFALSGAQQIYFAPGLEGFG